MPDSTTRTALVLDRVGAQVLRYGLVFILLYFGAFKFTPTEAAAIQPLLANSPFMAWLYSVASVEGVSRLIGVAEIAAALLIALRVVSPLACAVGSIMAVGTFLTTLSFLATTPDMFAWVDGFLVPTGGGGFIIKDLFLLGAALVSAGEALGALGASRRPAVTVRAA